MDGSKKQGEDREQHFRPKRVTLGLGKEARARLADITAKLMGELDEAKQLAQDSACQAGD